MLIFFPSIHRFCTNAFNPSIQLSQPISCFKSLSRSIYRFCTKFFKPFYTNVTTNFVIEFFYARQYTGFALKSLIPPVQTLRAKKCLELFSSSIQRFCIEIVNSFKQILQLISWFTFLSPSIQWFRTKIFKPLSTNLTNNFVIEFLCP